MHLINKEHLLYHIHIKYGEYEAIMELDDLNIVQGTASKKHKATSLKMGRD
jgi:hypothetical protein